LTSPTIVPPFVPPPQVPPVVTPPPPPATATPAPPPQPSTRPSAIPFPPVTPPRPGPPAILSAPARQFSIRPRSSAGIEAQSFPLPTGEHAYVVSGGVILIVHTDTGNGLVDIEADRLVFWTRGNPQQVLNNLRTPQGQASKELEFYMAGNVEIREQQGKENRILRADEVYYDVGRNVAVALHADIEFRQPGLTDPVHVRADELDQLSPELFQGLKAEVYSSRLPSDPGLKIYVANTTIESKQIPRRSIFGVPFTDPRTGQPETEQQRLIRSRNVFLEVDNVPIFYLPYIQGDANDPLGPLENVSLGYNSIFGFQAMTSFNMFNLLGIDPDPGKRWRLDVDYLSLRGPALGTQYEYFQKSILGVPAQVTGLVKAFGIDDSGTDVLGGGRGQFDNHPELRGRFLWTQNVQGLPYGFVVQSQINALSDKNFLEQYFESDFDNNYLQDTFLYVKQQQDNWAWTFLTQPGIRNWVNQTEYLPRVDGWLIGQSFFDLLTYNAHASGTYARLRPTDVPPPPESITTQENNTGRLDLAQELSLPFTLGPFRIVPYVTNDLTYYSEDLTGSERGRAYFGGGLRASIPFTRLYCDIQSELLNLNGINHKIVLSGFYYVAHSDTPFNRLPQLDRINDDATDQALRDIKPEEPFLNPAHGVALATSPQYDPQLYAISRLVDNRIDTLDSVQVFELDLRQRWQTKRGFPGMQHIVDWMTLDVAAEYFPNSAQDNLRDFSFVQYDWTWNIGDRTALLSNGWFEPYSTGARVFSIAANLNRPDRTSFYLGYRQIDPLNSRAVVANVSYVFSPKYAITASTVYDFGVNTQVNSLILTRMGSDVQLSLGVSYNSILSTFGVTFEIVPNLLPANKRIPGMSALGPGMFGR
jgi:hypothetical protein